LRILVDVDLLTENILARRGQVDEGLTAKVAISELLTKFETKHHKMFMQWEVQCPCFVDQYINARNGLKKNRQGSYELTLKDVMTLLNNVS
jgi:hypothetical protein